MASSEIEIQTETPAEQQPASPSQPAWLDRRRLMAALGVASAVAGVGLAQRAAAQQPTPNGYNQLDVVNFLLAIEYLKATIYSYVYSGADLPGSTGVTTGSGGVYNAFTKFSFSGLVNNAQATDLFAEMYYDTLNQLIALRSLQGTATIGRPTMNLLGTGTTTTTTVTPTTAQVLAIARELEDLSVEAFAGAAIYLTGNTLSLAVEAQAVSGFHAGALRLLCIQNNIPYLGTSTLTTTSSAQSVNSITVGTTDGSSLVYIYNPTNAAVVGNLVTGSNVPPGTVITAVTTIPTITGSLTGTSTAPSNTVTNLSSTTNLAVGQTVTGTGIPVNSTISSISGNTITLAFPVAIPSNGSPGFSSLATGIVTTANNVALTLGFTAVILTKSTTLSSVSSFQNLALGQPLTGTNIPAGTTITALNPAAGTITMSAAATGVTTVATTGIVTKGSSTITSVTSINGIVAGLPISATGIPTGAVVASFDPVALTITWTGAGAATASSGSTIAVTITTYETVTPGTGTIVLSKNATATGGSTITQVTPDSMDVIPADPAVITFSATTASGSTSVTAVSSTTGLAAGLQIVGPGIASGTTIAAVSGSTLTLSTAATASATGVLLNVYPSNSASAAAAGPQPVPNASGLYQGFFNTAGTGTATANTPAGFAFTRTFSQTLSVLYGGVPSNTSTGGFFPYGNGTNINVV